MATALKIPAKKKNLLKVNVRANGANPVELIEAICGSKTIQIKGFGAEPMPYSWVRPKLQFVNANEYSVSNVKFIEKQLRSEKIISTLISILTLVFGVSVGLNLEYLIR